MSQPYQYVLVNTFALKHFLLLVVNTLRVAKPEKGAQIESALIRMAQSGQLGGKLSEEELIGLLERFSESTAAPKTTVKFDRRRAALDSDDSD